MNFPVVLVISNCSKTPAKDVIANIRKIPNDEGIQKDDEDSTTYFVYDINTKYYNTQIALLPIETTENLSETVKSRVEGVLVYLDSNDRSVLEKLPCYVDFIKVHQIELSVVLCKELSDDDNSGVTFKCIKDCYNMLDVIELEKSITNDVEDNEEDDHLNPSGYGELVQALKSVIWSNVDINHVSSHGKSQVSNENNEIDENTELDVEAELENFEKLLSQMMQFRPATSNMSREDRLNCAQGFAEVFEKLIMQDEDLNDLE